MTQNATVAGMRVQQMGEGTMDNVFGHLQARRESREAHERVQVEARRAAERRDEQLRRLQLEAAGHCSETVIRVLTLLQQAAYPTGQVRNHIVVHDSLHDHLRGVPAWSIGHSDVYWATDSCKERAWYADVVVRLEFNGENRPTSLSCSRIPGACVRTWFGRKFVEPHARCGLAEGDLIQALNQLFPAQELDEANA